MILFDCQYFLVSDKEDRIFGVFLRVFFLVWKHFTINIDVYISSKEKSISFPIKVFCQNKTILFPISTELSSRKSFCKNGSYAGVV